MLDRVDARALRRPFLVVVDVEARREQDDVDRLGQPFDRPVQEGPGLRGGRQHLVEVRLHRHVVGRQARERPGLDVEPAVFDLRPERVQRLVPEPEPTQPGEHQTRVDQREGAQPLVRERDQLAVEPPDPELLQIAGVAPALLEARQVLLGGEQLQHVELLRGEVPVPERCASARHHRRLLRRNAVLAEQAPQERDPVLELVADLAQERAEEDRGAVPAGLRDRPLGPPCRRAHLGLAP